MGGRGSARAALQQHLEEAQRAANDGYLVVIGLVTGPKGRAGGHVAVVLPGVLSSVETCWANAGLLDRLPLIAQAGRDIFAGKSLNYGITPKDTMTSERVVYVRRP